MTDDAGGTAVRRGHSGGNGDSGRRGGRRPRPSLSKKAKRKGDTASSSDDDSDSSDGGASSTAGDSEEAAASRDEGGSRHSGGPRRRARAGRAATRPRQRRRTGRLQEGGDEEEGSAGDDSRDGSQREKDARTEMPGVLDEEAESILQEFLNAQQAQESPAEQEEANADPYQDATASHDLLASNPSLVDQALYLAIHGAATAAAEAEGSVGAAAGTGLAPAAARAGAQRSKSVESVGSSGDVIRCSSTDTEDELIKKQGKVVRKYNAKAQYWTDRAQELLRLSEDGFRPGTMKRDKKAMKESKRKKDKKEKKKKKESKPDKNKRDLEYNQEALRRAGQAQKTSGVVVRSSAQRSAGHAALNMAGMW